MSAEEIAEWFATGGGNEWGADPESAYAAYEQAQQLYEWFETGGGREWGTDPESAYQAYTQAQAEAGYAEQTEYDQVYTEEEIAAYNAAQQAQYEATPAAGTPADFGGHGAASSPVRRFAARVAVAMARVAREGGGCSGTTGLAIFSEVHFTN